MLTFTSGGRTYEWGGGFGSIVVSYERGITVGDVRVIEDELFHAYIVERRRWRSSRVCWTQPHASAEHLRRLKARFFSVQDFAAVGAAEA